MHPATLQNGVRPSNITKLYYIIFAALEESMTLNLAQRLSEVIDFGTNRKRVIHIPIIVVDQ